MNPLPKAANATSIPRSSLPALRASAIPIGIVAAVAALAFVRTLYGFEDLAERIPIKPWLLTPVGFALVGVVCLFVFALGLPSE